MENIGEIWKKTGSAVVFIVAVILLIDFAWVNPSLQSIATSLNEWAVVIGAFALGLGAYSLLTRHVIIIVSRKSNWPYSIVLLMTMSLFVLVGLITGSITSKEYVLIYSTIKQPISTTLYGINAFFIASASFRAFRAKSWESAILLVAAIFMMLKNAPIGGVISPIIPAIADIIWDISANTGMRALLIGIGIGTLSLGLRVIIGQEKTPVGG